MREASSLVLARAAAGRGGRGVRLRPGRRRRGRAPARRRDVRERRGRRGRGRRRRAGHRVAPIVGPRLGGAAPDMRTPVLIDGRNALDPDADDGRRVRVRGHRAHPGDVGVSPAGADAGGGPGGRRGPAPAPAHRHPPQADDAAGGPAVRRPPARPAAPPRRDRRRVLLRLPARRAARPTSATARASGCACATWSTRSRSARPARSRTPSRCSTTTPFLVLNGDILTDLDLGAVDRAPRASGRPGTIALTPVEDPSAFGLVRLHDDASVEAFVEKPSPEELRPGEPFRINAGTYLLSPSVLDGIPPAAPCSIEREIFPAARRPAGPLRLPERRLLARHRHARLVPGREPRRAGRARSAPSRRPGPLPGPGRRGRPGAPRSTR